MSIKEGKQRVSWFPGIEWPEFAAYPDKINPWDFGEIQYLYGLGLAEMPEWKEFVNRRVTSLSSASQKLADGITKRQKNAEASLPFSVVSITTNSLVVQWKEETFEFTLEEGKLKKHWNSDGQPRMGDSAFLDAMLSASSLNNVGGLRNLPDRILYPEKDKVSPQEYVETIQKKWEDSQSHNLYLLKKMEEALIAISSEIAKIEKIK